MTERPFLHIFYPEHIEPVKHGEPTLTLPRAILVPNAAYDWVKEEIRAPYGQIAFPGPKLVIILTALHQEILMESKGRFAFIPEGALFCHAPLFDTPLPAWMERNDSYFHEEPAPEELSAVSLASFPSVQLLPILVGKDLNGEECQKLAMFLDKAIQVQPETVVVAAVNGNALGTSKAANKEMVHLTQLLLSGKPLLEALHSRIITSVGTPILESLRRSKKLDGPWHLTRFSLRSHHYTTLPEIIPEEIGQCVWHLSGWKGN